MKANQEQSGKATKKTDASIGKLFSGRDAVATVSAELEDKIELERREAYIEPKTRDFLRIMLQNGDNSEVTPTYCTGLGYIYEIASPDSEESADKISKDFLLNLARLDILKQSFYDSVASCPKCESIILTFHNRCPKCKSHNVDKASLTEHIPCGFINQRDKYINDICPKCGEALVEGQFRNMGRWYVCQKCSDRFENPEFDLICHNCNKNFTIKETHIVEVPKFSLNLQRKKEIRQNVASLEDIRLLLKELDFSIEIPGYALGQKSGMQHHFSLIAKRSINGQEFVIALDHATSESEVQASPLILYIYKTSEVKVDIPIFIAIPKLADTARQIARGHDIILVEGLTEETDILADVRTEILNRIQKIIDETRLQAISEPEKKPQSSLFGKFKGITKLKPSLSSNKQTN